MRHPGRRGLPANPTHWLHLTHWKRINLVAVLLALALLPWLILPCDKLSIVLLVAEFSIFIAYVIRPVRLKERGVWAILADARLCIRSSRAVGGSHVLPRGRPPYGAHIRAIALCVAVRTRHTALSKSPGTGPNQ